MRIRTLLTTAVAVTAGFLSLGCNTSPTGGNPSTSTKSDKFTLKAPTLSTTVKQGDRQTVTLTLDRGADFKDSVKLETEAPKGVKAELSKSSVAASDPADVTLTLEAAKDAAVGDHIVKVKATPGSGVATSVDVKLKVEAPK